jgi:hypothetical protein
MTRPNFRIIFCVSLALFFGSVKILYANDPCTGTSLAPVIGQKCTGGAIYAGTGYSSNGLNPELRYMVTPGGCKDKSCTEAGGTDSVTTAWATGNYANNSTGITDIDNGKINTAALIALGSSTPAVLWCSGMNFGGYTDWYLPAKKELADVLYPNQAKLGGFVTSGGNYWSSTETNATQAGVEIFDFGGQGFNDKPDKYNYVRCIRSY